MFIVHTQGKEASQPCERLPKYFIESYLKSAVITQLQVAGLFWSWYFKLPHFLFLQGYFHLQLFIVSINDN